jgi:hypothetical protein
MFRDQIKPKVWKRTKNWSGVMPEGGFSFGQLQFVFTFVVLKVFPYGINFRVEQ